MRLELIMTEFRNVTRAAATNIQRYWRGFKGKQVHTHRLQTHKPQVMSLDTALSQVKVVRFYVPHTHVSLHISGYTQVASRITYRYKHTQITQQVNGVEGLAVLRHIEREQVLADAVVELNIAKQNACALPTPIKSNCGGAPQKSESQSISACTLSVVTPAAEELQSSRPRSHFLSSEHRPAA